VVLYFGQNIATVYLICQDIHYFRRGPVLAQQASHNFHRPVDMGEEGFEAFA
jgi:hypothetical protein